MDPDKEYRRYAARKAAHHAEISETYLESGIEATGLARYYNPNAATVLDATAAASLSDRELLSHAWLALGLPPSVAPVIFHQQFGIPPAVILGYLDQPDHTSLLAQQTLARVLIMLDGQREAEAAELYARVQQVFRRVGERLIGKWGAAGVHALRADAERSSDIAHHVVEGPDETGVMAAKLTPGEFEVWYLAYLERMAGALP